MPLRRAVPRAAVAAACLGCLAPAALATETDTVLVKVDPSAPPAERALIGEALDATSSTPLMAGWREYRLDDPATLAEARSDLSATEADLAVSQPVRLYPDATPNDPYWSAMWGLEQSSDKDIDASAGWDLQSTRSPVTVAVIDTGTQITHPDLAPNIWTNPGEVAANGVDDDGNGYVDDVNGWDFHGNNASVFDSASTDQHGTHVSGTIAAVRDNGAGIPGVADNVTIMPLKFISGSGSNTNAIKAIQYAVSKGAKVINASFGYQGAMDTALCDAITTAMDQGVLFVAAAGNNNLNLDSQPHYPAACPDSRLISVVASDQNDLRASFSNYSATRTDIAAPGVSIYSTIPTSTYGGMQGTSMATPNVAGVAAVALGEAPGLTVSQLRTAVLNGAEQVSALAPYTENGRRLNLPGAILAAEALAGPGDFTAPAAPTLSSPAAASYSASARPTLSWTASADSDVTAYEVTLNGLVVGSVAGTSWTPSSNLVNGTHTWTVRAKDASGNQSAAPTARTFTVDATAPAAVTPTAPAANLATSDTTPSFAWKAATDKGSSVASYRITVDGAVAATVSSPTLTWTPSSPLAEGAHSWQVHARDQAGNYSATAKAMTFRVDTTAPAVPTGQLPAGGTLGTARPALSWTAASDGTGSGVAGYQVSVDGGAAVTVTGTKYTPPAQTPGSHTWTVRSKDRAGNLSAATTSRTFIVAPAAVTQVSPANLVKTNDATPTLTWKAASGASTYVVSVDGQAAATVSALTWTPSSDLADGTHTWSVKGKDASGNLSLTATTRSIVVDTTAPSAATSLAAAFSATAPARPTLSWAAATDSGTGILNYAVSIDGGTAVTVTGLKYTPASNLSSGSHSWTVVARDRAGNTSTAANGTVNVQ